MEEPKLLPRVHKQIRRILKNLKARPLDPIPKYKYKYSSICNTPKGAIFFKARMVDDVKVKRSFRNEIVCTQQIDKVLKNNHKVEVPNILEYHFDTEPEWAVFDVASGEQLMKDGEKVERIKPKIEWIDDIINAVLEIQRISLSKLYLKKEGDSPDKPGFWQTDYLWYLDRISKSLHHLRGVVDSKKAVETLGVVTKAGRFIEEFPKVLAHGDLSLLNMFKDNGHIVFCDWEHTRIDLPISDIAFLYARTEGYKKEWTRELVKRYFKQIKGDKNLKLMFRVAVIRQMLKQITSIRIDKENGYISSDKMKRRIKNHLDVFHRAIEGFDVLIKE